MTHSSPTSSRRKNHPRISNFHKINFVAHLNMSVTLLTNTVRHGRLAEEVFSQNLEEDFKYAYKIVKQK